MVRFVNYFLTLLILPLTALSGDYFSVFERRVAGADQFVAVDPILDMDRELAGFVFCDATNHEIVVYDLEDGVRNRIAVNGRPVEVVNRGDFDGQLEMFVGEVRPYGQPYLTKITIGSGHVEMTSKPISYKGIDWANTTVEQLVLRFAGPPSISDNLLVSVMMGFEMIEMTQGVSYSGIGSSSLFDDNLEEVEYWPSRSNTAIGDLSGDRSLEVVSATNYYHTYDYRDSYDSDDYGNYTNTRFQISDQIDAEVYSRVIGDGYSDWMRVGEFNGSNTNEELIYCGTADLNSGTVLTHRRTACYSIDGTSADEIWQYGSSTFFPELIYPERNALVGMDRKAVKLLDYRVGSLIDSIELNRLSTAHQFFLTGIETSELNVVLIYDDVVVVNHFNAPTYTPTRTNDEIELPKTFSLHQNHPNPFNATTMISFDNEQSQQLALVVFNILGREIATLYSGVTSPGYYQFIWNGLDQDGHEQATGIYFAQLRSADDSQMIKLVLLK